MGFPNMLSTLATSLVLAACCTSTYGQTQATNANSKRGLAFPGTNHTDDLALFFSLNSTVRWYHNWSPNPSRTPSNDQHPLEFLPMIHGTDNLRNDIRAVQRLSNTNQNPTRQRRVLSFNEPDGTIASGGSNISPADAARAYIQSILPLRTDHSMLISHPSVTGTSSGINWLREFNNSCHALRTGGCATDFIAVHFYGPFDGLAAFLAQIHGFYNEDPATRDLPLYITEFALVQSDPLATAVMLNQSLAYLDTLSYVASYAWFGLFRTTEANTWTGAGNAMLDEKGGLTDIGSAYIGGSGRGFSAGMRGNSSMFETGWVWGVGGNSGGFEGGGGGGSGYGYGGGGGDGNSALDFKTMSAGLWKSCVVLALAWAVSFYFLI